MPRDISKEQAKFREALLGRTIQGVELTRGHESDWVTLKLVNGEGKEEQVRFSSGSIYNEMYLEKVGRKKKSTEAKLPNRGLACTRDMNINVTCDRCHGKGTIQVFFFRQCGVCFRCRLHEEDLLAPGAYVADVSLEKEVLQVNRRKFSLPALGRLTRAQKIKRAADLLAEMDGKHLPRGFEIAELLCIAKVADKDVADRILRAIDKRVKHEPEAKDIAGLRKTLSLL